MFDCNHLTGSDYEPIEVSKDENVFACTSKPEDCVLVVQMTSSNDFQQDYLRPRSGSISILHALAIAVRSCSPRAPLEIPPTCGVYLVALACYFSSEQEAERQICLSASNRIFRVSLLIAVSLHFFACSIMRTFSSEEIVKRLENGATLCDASCYSFG